jgi:DNA-directed RNA polymerase specialized sigma24 family protein
MSAGASFGERFHGGETAAIEEMVAALGPAAFAVADAILGDADEAEGVAAGAVATVIERERDEPIEAEHEAEAVLRLARLRAVALRREREGGRRRRRQEHRQEEETLRAHPVPLPPATEALAAVGALRAQAREAVSLAFFEGLTLYEVASRAGATVETTRQRLRGGLAELQEVPTGPIEAEA